MQEVGCHQWARIPRTPVEFKKRLQNTDGGSDPYSPLQTWKDGNAESLKDFIVNKNITAWCYVDILLSGVTKDNVSVTLTHDETDSSSLVGSVCGRATLWENKRYCLRWGEFTTTMNVLKKRSTLICFGTNDWINISHCFWMKNISSRIVVLNNMFI